MASAAADLGGAARTTSKTASSASHTHTHTPPRTAYKYVVIGGGVAGVTCAAELASIHERQQGSSAEGARVSGEKGTILLVSASSFIKGVTNYVRLSDALESFDVEEKHLSWISTTHPCVDVCVDVVSRLEADEHMLVLSGGTRIQFDRVCICTGAMPRTVLQHPLIIGLRDTHLADMMKGARRIAILGNGGIALGLVHELHKHEVIWVVKDEYIGNTFFDASASDFFLKSTDMGKRIVVRPPPAGTSSDTETIAPRVDGPPLNWHDDQPLPAALLAAEEPTEGVVEITPSYDPLPPRERRKRARGPVAHASSASSSLRAAAPAATPAADFRVAHARGDIPYGSCLGPGWINVLRHVETAAPGPDVDARSAHGTSVQLHLGAEVTAVRGHGVGASGALATGEWIPLSTISLVRATPAGLAGASGGAWPLEVRLTTGVEVGCDFLVSATGVRPAFAFLAARPATREDAGALQRWGTGAAPLPDHLTGSFIVDEDGGLLVNKFMQTTGSPDVYAAGDCASLKWPQWLAREDPSRVCTWFQMRLWAQARQQALHAARSMANALHELDEDDGGVHFELFAHMTKFLGFKVVLLGLFNGQGLDTEYARAIAQYVRCTTEGVTAHGLQVPAQPTTHPGAHDLQVCFRVTPGVEYIKVIVTDGRVIGAILIGDTDLEETLENLILNRLSIRLPSGELLDILNPDVDVEDFFD